MGNVKYVKYITLFGKIVKTAILWGCIGHCTVEHVGELVWCTGSSMEPTLHNNDLLITSHLRRLRKVKYNDIVIAQSVTEPKILVCKRVTALEGDVVLYYNRYIIIPPGYTWLMGDNRDNSNDSRDYGPVPLALIKGHVVCRLWPFTSACFF